MKKLELILEGFNIKVELDEGFLNVRTVPGIAHGTASGVFLGPISRWAENDQPFSTNGIDVLINSMDTSMSFSLPSANIDRLSLLTAVDEVARLFIYTERYHVPPSTPSTPIQQRTFPDVGV